MNNQMQMLKQMMSKNVNPQGILKQMVGNNPVFSNLLNMAQQGDKKGVENFARNLYKEKGRDFDKEFQDFMNNFK
ncbi:MAG: hypothetical protein IJ272_02130 [Clostridia bacterium]|nr:hypothetical protein [Clostridia bacterium]